MKKIHFQHKTLSNATARLYEAINNLEKLDKKTDNQLLDFIANKKLKEAFEDSLVKRFKLTIDLFWKYIKKILELQLKEPSELNSPRSVIESACKSKILSEQDAEKILEMIKCRNKTSHIYLEEISDTIGAQVPGYYKIIKKYVEKLTY